MSDLDEVSRRVRTVAAGCRSHAADLRRWSADAEDLMRQVQRIADHTRGAEGVTASVRRAMARAQEAISALDKASQHAQQWADGASTRTDRSGDTLSLNSAPRTPSATGNPGEALSASTGSSRHDNPTGQSTPVGDYVNRFDDIGAAWSNAVEVFNIWADANPAPASAVPDPFNLIFATTIYQKLANPEDPARVYAEYYLRHSANALQEWASSLPDHILIWYSTVVDWLQHFGGGAP